MSLKGNVWIPIGPTPVSESGGQDNGMVTAIAVNPNNPAVMYIGTAGGGVWRTRDGGNTWTPLFDRQLTLGIGEPGGVAIDPNNTDVIYVGTSQRVMLGTGNTGIFGAPDTSQGLFKSTDGGNSWIQLGSGFPAGNTGNALILVGLRINVVIVDPANSQNLYLSSSSGVFFSTNGGQNWTAGNNAIGDARSLVLDTSSPVGSRISTRHFRQWRFSICGWRTELDANSQRGDAGRCRGNCAAHDRLQQGHHCHSSAPFATQPGWRPGALCDLGRNGRSWQARPDWSFSEHRSGRDVEAANRHWHAARISRRLQLPHGCGPGFSRRRAERYHLFRRCRAGQSTNSGEASPP